MLEIREGADRYTTLCRLGRKRLGDISPEAQATLAAISSVERLEELLDRVTEIESWDELLGKE